MIFDDYAYSTYGKGNIGSTRRPVWRREENLWNPFQEEIYPPYIQRQYDGMAFPCALGCSKYNRTYWPPHIL
jgi:hypothetical protein